MRRVRVLVADGRSMDQEGLARAVDGRADLELVGDSHDGQAVLADVLALRPDVAVLDPRMPGLDHVAVLSAVAHEGISTRTVLLAGDLDGRQAYAAIALGAGACLGEAEADHATVCDAILAVARGQTILSPAIQSGLAAEIELREAEQHHALDGAREAMRRLEDAQRLGRVGSWELDLHTGRRFYTRQMYAIQGMDPDVDEPWGMDELLANVVPEHHHRIHEAVTRARAQPGPVEVEYRMHSPVDRVILTTMEVVRGPDGEPRLSHGTTQDVTELRQNEQRLADAERVAGIGSFEWRRSDGRVIWSPGSYRLFGVDPEGPPVTTAQFYAPMLPAEAETVRAAFQEALRVGGACEFAFTLPPVDGTAARRHVHGQGEVYEARGDTFVHGTIQDVTRARLVGRQQQEIARLGQLALAETDPAFLFDEVCRIAVELVGTDVADILELQPDGSLAFAATHGFTRPRTGIAIAADQDSIAHRALADDAAVVVTDWLTEERYPYFGPLREHGVRRTTILPIRGRSGPFGVLTTHALSPELADPAQNTAFLDALASFLATAVERLRHEAEIASLAELRGRLVVENLEAEERVRQRISEQLHDGVLQELLAARQDLVEAAAFADRATRDEMLGHARSGLDRAVKLLREAVHALHPVVLQHGGLEAAMRAAANQAARQGRFAVEVDVDEDAADLVDELVLSVARELLTNCAKHAEASTVRVELRRREGAVVLVVADDGRGLDPDAVAAAPLSGHIGLASLAQRVEAVGGTLDLGGGGDGRPGTTVTACLPV